MNMKKRENIPICSLCERKINKNKDFFLGRIGRDLPWYKPFHKKCYEEVILSLKSKLRRRILNKSFSKESTLKAIIKEISIEKHQRIGKIEIAIRKFWHNLAANKLNSLGHWILSIFFSILFLVLGYCFIGNTIYFQILVLLVGLQLTLEFSQLIYFSLKYKF